MKWIVVITLLLSAIVNSAFAANVGFKKISLSDNLERPLNVAIWYPSHQSSPEKTIADNAAFEGTNVVENGTIDAKSAPIVLFSHGYRGNWRNGNWLATELVKRGYVVAAPDHSGTTTFDHSAENAAQWWQRPKDLSRVLDYLLSADEFATVVNADDVTAIGHSLGGWTVMHLAGAQFDRPTLFAQCQIHFNPRVCGLTDELGLSTAQRDEPPSDTLKDPRIKRVVSLDLGLARSFSPRSLADIRVPSLVLAAGIDIGDLPQVQESGYLAEYLPLLTRRYKVYEHATHFSFMQLCKDGAIALLEEEVPGDGVVCKDGVDITRKALHQQMLTDILAFIDAN